MPIEKPYILYDNRLDDGTPTATTTASGYSVLNLSDWRSYTYWKAGSTATQYITVDAGSAKAADSLAIISHDLFTRGASISVECSSDNFGADITVALAAFAPTSDKAIFKTFTSISKRYWRLKITGLTAACFMGILVIGARLTFNRYLTEEFDPIGEEPVGESLESVQGQPLGSVVSFVKNNSKISLRIISDSWFTNTFKPAWDNHISKFKPFFFVWNFTNFPTDIRLMWLSPGQRLEAPYEGLTRKFSLEFHGVKE